MTRLLFVPLALLVGCGGSSTAPTPTPTPVPAANRAPVINAMSFSPTFGIVNLTQFSYSSAASDPDGDPINSTWNIAGNGSTTPSGQIGFTSGGNGVATLTVSDGRGGTVSDTRTFVVGTMAGVWGGTLSDSAFTMTLSQPTGGTVTGTWTLPGTPFSGTLDPAALNTITSGAAISLRCKVTAGGGSGGITDFTLTGTMDPTGARLSGGITGSGFGGQPFALTK
jgi:hypothetical protein